MSEKKQEFHGSDLEKVEAYYGIKKETIIPFAGNVNPLGISPLITRNFVLPFHYTVMSQWNISLLEMVQPR